MRSAARPRLLEISFMKAARVPEVARVQTGVGSTFGNPCRYMEQRARLVRRGFHDRREQQSFPGHFPPRGCEHRARRYAGNLARRESSRPAIGIRAFRDEG